HTITGGEKWIDRTRPCGSPCIRPADLLRVRFTNQQSGWVVGERGAFLYTPDAGFTWLEPELPNPISLYGLAFPNSREGWAVGEQGTIIKIIGPPS
ncbi:MAG: YCF48-related protein, partial [Nitrospirales bacterium]